MKVNHFISQIYGVLQDVTSISLVHVKSRGGDGFEKLILDDIRQWTHVDAYDKVLSKSGLHLVSMVSLDQNETHPNFKNLYTPLYLANKMVTFSNSCIYPDRLHYQSLLVPTRETSIIPTIQYYST